MRILVLLTALLLSTGVNAAARVGSWAAMTEGSDPTGSPTVGAGTNRMFICIVNEQTNGEITISTFTVGGQAASYTDHHYQDSGSADINIDMFLWNETAIGAMSGTTISYVDNKAATNVTWSCGTYSAVDQVSPTFVSGDGTTTVALTTTSVAADQILCSVEDINGADAPLGYDTLTEQVEYSVANHATGFADGVGGDGTTTVTSGTSTVMSGTCIVLADASSINNAVYRRGRGR